MNHPLSPLTPLAWLVAFQQEPDEAAVDASFSAHLDPDAWTEVIHLTYLAPEGHYLECATPLYDEAFITELHKDFGTPSGTESVMTGVQGTPQGVLADVIYRLVVAHAKATALELAQPPLWYIRAPFKDATGDLDLLVRAASDVDALTFWHSHYEGHDFDSAEPPIARLVPATEPGPISWDLLV